MLWKVSFLPLTFFLLTKCLGIESQDCGIVDTDPAVTIQIQKILDTTPFRTEIWRSKVFNVNTTTAVTHPHYKYISAYKLTNNDYYFTTSAAFPNFIQNEGTNIILRGVYFNCLGGGSTRYNFEIPVEETDKHEPKFLQEVYTLEITEDWPLLTKSINQESIIIVGDADTDITNADLTFRSNFVDGNQENIIKVNGTPLWSTSNPPPKGPFYYRIDLYLEKSLKIGVYEFFVSASSRQRAGSTLVKLSVK